ncbi:MAG TPA: bifunctional homocysteine S-methyltransferase/methylenetetrahydrofolate reductase [bacterium]|jgi:homocysteine S-methyltransferase|nr:bifunctional homocysteine S-methyltransferase/methylenetetrahydrofolate reductase [bacterium]
MIEARSVDAFLERLDRGPLLADGAMGTMLYARGVPFDEGFDALNVAHPEVVRGVHTEYLAAGAELIETNTFGANRFKLSLHNLEDQVGAINRAGAAVAAAAREAAAAGRTVWIAGSIGPIGRPLAPLGGTKPAEVRAAFAEQAAALAEGGVDLLIFETFSDLRELAEGVAAARAATGLPIIAQMTFTHEGKTLLGHAPAEIVARLEELGAHVIGANCSVGSQGILEVMEQMVLTSRAPLSAMPNAGFPSYVDGRIIYFSTPAYMADYARRMVELGVTIVGGCCGTTPAHIAAMREVLATIDAPPSRRLITMPAVPASAPAAPTGPTALAGRLGIERGFTVSVEVAPPRGTQEGPELEACRLLGRAGVDAINVPDNPMARLRMSPWAMCLRIQTEAHLDTILHFTTRDRNLVRVQSDLLALHALGIRNVLVLRGDPPQLGDYPTATAVSDVKPSGLIRLIKEFNQGRDLAGNDLGQPTGFLVGAALNMGARDLDRELRALERKLRAGADFLCTMPIYDPETLDRVLDRTGPLPVPLLVGVLPLHGLRHAEFLHNEVPGMTIPASLRAALRDAKDARELGLRLAAELMAEIRRRAQGAYLIPSFGRYDRVLHLVESLRKDEAAPQMGL